MRRWYTSRGGSQFIHTIRSQDRERKAHESYQPLAGISFVLTMRYTANKLFYRANQPAKEQRSYVSQRYTNERAAHCPCAARYGHYMQGMEAGSGHADDNEQS